MLGAKPGPHPVVPLPMLLVGPRESDRHVNVCVQVTAIKTRSQNHAVLGTLEPALREQVLLPCGVGDVFPSGPSG